MRALGLAVLSRLISATVALAQYDDIPLQNWTVPPYTASGTGGIRTMTDVSPLIPFVAVRPCRLVDTRGSTSPNFPAGYGPPGLAGGVPRNFDLNSAAHCAGIPAEVEAYSLNVTVTNTQGPGFILIYPQGGIQPTVSTLNYVAGQTIANAAIVPAGTNGGVTVIAGVSGTDLVIDINGYFSTDGDESFLFGGGFRVFVDDRFGPAAEFRNNAIDCGGICGISLRVESTSGSVQGLLSRVVSTGQNSAALFGRQGDFLTTPTYPGAGVRGEGPLIGVAGITKNLPTAVGVGGSLLNATGGVLAEGYLGYAIGPNYGVYSTSNFGGAGAKYFVDPHPTDPSKVIRYISLEGNEPGTYFRGRGKFQRGMARIPVPEDFRMVTDDEGLTVQITPIGGMASVGVLKADLNEIVVQSSRNLEFYYMVNGIRRTHKHLASPIGEGAEFMPRSPDATMPLSLTEEQKALLIRNGTYKPDGTVNLETARRLGWDKVWEQRMRPAPVMTP